MNFKQSYTLIGIANALPILGYYRFGFRPNIIGLLYWVDAVSIVFLYSFLGLFANPEPDSGKGEDSNSDGRAWLTYFLDREVKVVPFAPPVNVTNFRSVFPATVLGMLWLLAAGYGVTVGNLGKTPTSGATVTDFFRLFSNFGRTTVLVMALVMVSIQFTVFYSYYFHSGRYRQMTGTMAMEIQAVYWVWFTMLTIPLTVYFFVAALLVLGLMPIFVPGTITLAIWHAALIGPFFGTKMLLESSRLIGERQPGRDDGFFISRFSPTPPSQVSESNSNE